jgi:hypothetical protein
LLFISDYVLRAPLRDDEISTTINAPAGRTRMQFYSEKLVYVRKGAANAEPPDSNFVNDGSASFPHPGGVIYEISVTAGDRYTFVADREVSGVLYVSFD